MIVSDELESVFPSTGCDEDDEGAVWNRGGRRVEGIGRPKSFLTLVLKSSLSVSRSRAGSGIGLIGVGLAISCLSRLTGSSGLAVVLEGVSRGSKSGPYIDMTGSAGIGRAGTKVV